MSTPAVFSNVLIEGNTIDFGGSTSFGFFGSSFGYDNCMMLGADSKVVANNLSGINVNGTMIDLISNYCIIQDNLFTRGSTAIRSYIYDTGILTTTIAQITFVPPPITSPTITVTSVIGFPSSGQLAIQSDQLHSGYQIVNYTGITGNTFTGCTTSGTGNLVTNNTVSWLAPTSGTLPSSQQPTILTDVSVALPLIGATIHASTTVGAFTFPPSGTIILSNSATSDSITYTGITAGSFTGCTSNPLSNNVYTSGDTIFWQPTKYDHVITNNIFDKTTFDGTHTSIVQNITPRSAYNTNINQTGYVLVPLYKFNVDTAATTVGPGPNVHASNAKAGAFGIVQASNNFGLNPALATVPAESMYVSLQGNVSTPQLVYFNFNGPINQFLPPDVKILKLQIGFLNAGNNSINGMENVDISSNNTNFGLELLVSNPTNINTNPNTLLDVYNTLTQLTPFTGNFSNEFNQQLTLLSSFTIGPSGTYTNNQFSNTTRYLTINVTGANSAQYVNTLSHDLYINLQVTYNVPSATIADVVASPLLIQYSW